MPSFLSPLFLLGALAAAIPVFLHLLRREPEPRVRFAAVKLLEHAPVESTDRRRIRELLLLALRVGEKPRWLLVDVHFVKKTPLVPLASLRDHAELADMQVLARGNRLSITPVTETQWRFITEHLL